MSRIINSVLTAAAMAVLASVPAHAQVGASGGQQVERGRPGSGWNDNRNTITVYRDAWYQGRSQTFSGEVRDLRNSGMNDEISSMRFNGTWEACTDGNFGGRCQTFTGDVGDLARVGFNDQISSLRPVRGGGGDGGGWGGGNGGGWNGGQQRGSITLYRDDDYRGQSSSFNQEVADLRPLGFNDEASSIRLRGAWEVCEDSYFRGRCQVIEDDVRSLRFLGLNDRISSMRPARRGGGGW